MRRRPHPTSLMARFAAARRHGGEVTLRGGEIRVRAFSQGGSPDGKRRFVMRAYTGVPMRVAILPHPVVIDLAGFSVTDKARPILKDHDVRHVVGHSESVTVEGGQRILIKGVFSGTGLAAREVQSSLQSGFPWQASVGAWIEALEKVPKGKTVTVNGRSWVGPLFVARKSQLKETSFVALGADDDTAASIAASRRKEADMRRFKKWLKANGFEFDQLSAVQRKTLRASFQAELRAKQGGRKGREGDDGGEGDQLDADLDAGADDDDDDEEDDAGSDDAGDDSDDADSDVEAGENADDAGSDDADDDIEASGRDVHHTLPRQKNKGGRRGTEAPGRRSRTHAQALTAADVQLSIRTEQKRVSGIHALEGAADHPRLIAKAIDKSWSVRETQRLLLLRSRPKAPGILSGNRALATAAVLEASLCMAAGVSAETLEASYDERTLEAASAPARRGVGIQEVCHEVIRAAGLHARPGRMGNEEIATAFRASERLVQASGSIGGFSTIGLTGILGNVANKAMLETWGTVESAARQVAAERDVNDFKQHTAYRLDTRGGFTQVGPDGELKHISLQETSFTNQLKTYGGMIALTREMIINDDLGAFLQIPRMFGRMAAVKLEEVFFTLWLSNPSTFWGSGNGNYVEGADTALSVTGLSVAVQKFLGLVDANGKPVMVMPRKLLVPPQLKVLANQLFKDQKVVGSTGPTPDSNPHQGEFTPVVSPYLSNSSYTGYSTTAFYLTANPADVASAEIAYLRGQRVPTIESGEMNFNLLGMGWRAFFDFGVAMRETQGSVKSKGAA